MTHHVLNCFSPSNPTLQKLVGALRRRGILTEGDFNGLCIPLGEDDFLSWLAVEIVCLAVQQLPSPTHTVTHFGEKWEGRDALGGANTQKGFNILWDSQLARLYLVALPCNPQCGYPVQSEAPALKARAQRLISEGSGFVRDLLLTARTAPHLVLMDATYVVITMPTGCHLRCRWPFVHQRDATVLGGSVLTSSTSCHLRGATKNKKPVFFPGIF